MYCNTSENVADIFTKPLGKIKFELLREMLGVDVNIFSIKGESKNNGGLTVISFQPSQLPKIIPQPFNILYIHCKSY
jgi:hypothetical protein